MKIDMCARRTNYDVNFLSPVGRPNRDPKRLKEQSAQVHDYTSMSIISMTCDKPEIKITRLLTHCAGFAVS
jgi:hypothetical protein